MPTPTDPTYFIDAENAAEMARLITQDRLVTKSTGGLLPERTDFSNVHTILDIACGPGGWVLDVAREYPKTKVTGVDISSLMIEYAHAQALTQRLDNATFRVMDVLKPLDFPDSSFDVVNARLLVSFMPATAWSKLVQECLRITRPKGVICLTECELPFTNSLASEKLSGMFAQALHVAGQSFSLDGQHSSITPMLGRLLRNGGYQNIQKAAYAIDFSAGMEAHTGIYQDLMVLLKLIQPFLIKWGVTTQEEVDVLYHRAMAEMMADDFCGMWFFLRVWGEKPSDKL